MLAWPLPPEIVLWVTQLATSLHGRHAWRSPRRLARQRAFWPNRIGFRLRPTPALVLVFWEERD